MISIGARLDCKYQITHKLGGGGFGEVFLADDEVIPGRKVAIKVLNRPRGEDHSDLLWEMRTLAQFNHPHVVTFYHHFADDDRVYLVMEFCSGGSLHDRLTVMGCYSPNDIFAWGHQLCDTLAFMHGKGIIHHDVKPQNILFAEDGTIKLGDFGIANRNLGTRLYMPPEMLLGHRVSRTDPRVDVYALGLTLLEAMTGRHPFEDLGPDDAIKARIAHNFIPSDLPRGVQEVLLKATHPTPELRFQTATDFGETIRGRHVPYVFDKNRIKADALAEKAEAAIARRKWRTAENLASFALELSPDCVAALLAAGRCRLRMRHIERAEEFFSRALSISARAQIQKELGWINLEQGRLPTAISLLTDHLQRRASDYEAFNLLMKCFYLSDRFDAAEALGVTLINGKAPSECFRSNVFLCRLLGGECDADELKRLTVREAANPFIVYNLAVATERPRAWSSDGPALLKSKLFFEEYRPVTAARPDGRDIPVICTPDGARHEIDRRIVTIGSLVSNDIVLSDRSVSRRHCAIVNFRDEVWLHDLRSTTGTSVDGQRLTGRVFLDAVHDVRVGSVSIRIAANGSRLI